LEPIMPTSSDTQPAFKLVLIPDRPALAAGHPTTLRVLARIQAPDASASAVPRRPLHLAIVLDRSGSMSGVPLDEAKRCARHMLDGLAPGDRAAIIAFDDEVARVAPLTSASRKLTLASALTTIESGGSTNLHGGWSAGADELAAQRAGDDVHRVILLSDGCANAGETDLETIAGQCKALAQRGVSTSTYGLGNHFNESLMLAMASAGRGNAYYGQTAADLAEPFAAEFALLTSLCARGLVLKVNAPASVAVRLRNDYVPVDGDPLAWHLPDLAFASEAWALFELTIDAADAVGASPLTLPITVSLQASTLDSAPLFLMGSLPALAVVDRAQWEAMPADPLVVQRLLELDAADAVGEVRAAIEAGDWQRAQQLVDAAAVRFAQHEWASAILATMRRLVGERDGHLAAKEASFSMRSMRGRLLSPVEPNFGVGEGSDLPVYLRRKAEQGKGRRKP
jgi:Ca-activated chloride channel family protein